MKKLEQLPHILFDAGGPILVFVILGVYAVFGLIIVGLIYVAIRLIIKAKKKKEQNQANIKEN